MALVASGADADDLSNVHFDPGRGDRGWPRAGQAARKNGFPARKRKVLSTFGSKAQ
ncbi:hypothetical protein [Ruixingdingia sedimenti]|uniref:Uncharacterized protein n=1 Tax=Ruixingdingia sedimenti TaxID=3073604 RepID=A0ABU1FEF1_9RHOB|nr:hypothetical protein [Xinfangfangia sp. LG-4]MDR5655241.1 hypothetical protein [Xinfangfangia sp. LG-4]